MIETIAALVSVISLLLAAGLLVVLTIIDFRVRLLPNRYVFPFAVLGFVFHASLNFTILPAESLIIGGLAGYILLFTIRALGNIYYKQESLGLGDVKLMGAAGLWLGTEQLMLALTIGATLSVLHGLIYALITRKSLRRLEIPAGPGLIGGIIVMIGWMLYSADYLAALQKLNFF